MSEAGSKVEVSAKNEGEDEGETAVQRLCFICKDDSPQSERPSVVPCSICKKSGALVHHACMNLWVGTRLETAKCPLCMTQPLQVTTESSSASGFLKFLISAYRAAELTFERTPPLRMALFSFSQMIFAITVYACGIDSGTCLTCSAAASFLNMFGVFSVRACVAACVFFLAALAFVFSHKLLREFENEDGGVAAFFVLAFSAIFAQKILLPSFKTLFAAYEAQKRKTLSRQAIAIDP